MIHTLRFISAAVCLNSAALAGSFVMGGYTSESPAWQIMGQFSGHGTWAALFGVTSLAAALGVRNLSWARYALYGMAGMMVMWALASLVAHLTGLSNTFTSFVFLFYLAALHFLVADWSLKLQVFECQVKPAIEELQDHVRSQSRTT